MPAFCCLIENAHETLPFMQFSRPGDSPQKTYDSNPPVIYNMCLNVM